ncbi:MAG: MbcA/ParS/Xre antitoxin family protein [Actinomycetota bacterium]|nr:MbcA/ParS/Xre antitoxin family protein [Actinomycetota bacterium]
MARALATKVSELTSTLNLSQEEMGLIVGATSRSVARWVSGEAMPQRLSKQRIIELAYVAEALGEVIKGEDANLWMFSPNKMLNHDTPAERIQSGDYRSVLAVIEALADGVVV